MYTDMYLRRQHHEIMKFNLISDLKFIECFEIWKGDIKLWNLFILYGFTQKIHGNWIIRIFFSIYILLHIFNSHAVWNSTLKQHTLIERRPMEQTFFIKCSQSQMDQNFFCHLLNHFITSLIYSIINNKWQWNEIFLNIKAITNCKFFWHFEMTKFNRNLDGMTLLRNGTVSHSHLQYSK